ncbi:probable G-protein coupled receptor 21 [Callorhinchus milii]|uniref:probable G-protein coupled receptor 21 n=1 Tax=Callorhinchus milii TaxID=7868 RepID=UPI001C3F8E45|nr:probable G-protein coupled receptor 21 [Callorhinchus milii]
MAVADLLVVVSDVVLRWVIVYFPVCFLDITPVCSSVMVTIVASTECSVWLTVFFTFDRCATICSQRLKSKYCTEKTAAVVIGTVCVLSCLESVPWYFKFEPGHVIDNVPWFCETKASYYTSSTWAALELIHRILVPLLPFLLILVSNALTVRHILASSKARRRFRTHSTGDRQPDPEAERRRKSITLLFAISGSFILLWTPFLSYFIYQRVGFMSNSYHPSHLAATLGVMLQLLSSCTNTCIYVATQSKFREELGNFLKYPCTLIVKRLGRLPDALITTRM